MPLADPPPNIGNANVRNATMHKNPLTWLIAGSTALLLAVGGLACTPEDKVNSGDGTSQSQQRQKQPAEEESQYANPKPADFEVELKTKSKQCYGAGVGCNVEVEPELYYIGGKEIDPSKTYDITYKITGDETGPVTETLTLTNGEDYGVFFPTLLSTPSSGTTVTAEVTSVEELY